MPFTPLYLLHLTGFKNLSGVYPADLLNFFRYNSTIVLTLLYSAV